MSLRVHFLASHLNFFHGNLNLSDEHGESSIKTLLSLRKGTKESDL